MFNLQLSGLLWFSHLYIISKSMSFRAWPCLWQYTSVCSYYLLEVKKFMYSLDCCIELPAFYRGQIRIYLPNVRARAVHANCWCYNAWGWDCPVVLIALDRTKMIANLLTAKRHFSQTWIWLFVFPILM